MPWLGSRLLKNCDHIFGYVNGSMSVMVSPMRYGSGVSKDTSESGETKDAVRNTGAGGIW
jgi:hypothetical protein